MGGGGKEKPRLSVLDAIRDDSHMSRCYLKPKMMTNKVEDMKSHAAERFF